MEFIAEINKPFDHNYNNIDDDEYHEPPQKKRKADQTLIEQQFNI